MIRQHAGAELACWREHLRQLQVDPPYTMPIAQALRDLAEAVCRRMTPPLKLKFRLPGCWRGVALYRGQRVVVTTPTRHEELRVVRGALPLLLPPGMLRGLRRQTIVEHPPIAPVA